MQSDRVNISLFCAVFAGLAAAVILAILGVQRGFAIAMLATGLMTLGCAGRIAAAQNTLALRPGFPKGWSKSRPFQFIISGAAITISGVTSLLVS